ncbi:MAG: hypothetical protein ACSLE8_08415, partial [Rhodococcus sp. (in: high G+C Gram-positive bacteria)]
PPAGRVDNLGRSRDLERVGGHGAYDAVGDADIGADSGAPASVVAVPPVSTTSKEPSARM